MDYDISLDKLESNISSINSIKEELLSLNDDLNSSYLGKLSGTPLEGDCNNVTYSIAKIHNGVLHCKQWLRDYNNTLNKVENNLIQSRLESIQKLIPLSGFYGNMFTNFANEPTDAAVDTTNMSNEKSMLTDVPYKDLIPNNESNNKVPYFTQHDPEWASTPFGNAGTIGNSGCGPTSLAMVLSYCTGKKITPLDLLDQGAANYASASGTNWEMFNHFAEQEGINVTSLTHNGRRPKPEELIDNLKKGNVIIWGTSDKEFAEQTHILTMTGVTEDGYITINDPNSNHADYSYKKYPVERIMQALSTGGSAWVFEPKK